MLFRRRTSEHALPCASALVLAICATPSQALAAEKPGSVFVQCDGLPAASSLVGAIVVITLTAGLAGGGEPPDAAKRVKGDAGAEACDAAIAKENGEIRRAELKLAKAVHRMEAGRDVEAAADARGLAEVAPGKSAEPGFKRGLALSALEIEGVALARQGKAAEAAALGLRMYQAAPYDLANLPRAARLISLVSEMTSDRRAFWDGVSRNFPDLLQMRADADEWAGDYAAAARDLESADAIMRGFLKEPEDFLAQEWLARMAVDRLLAGDEGGADRAATAARKEIEEALRTNKRPDATVKAQELLDLHGIVKLAREGKVDAARQAFAARSRWLAPSAPVAAEVTRRLREGAQEGQLIGALALDPARIRVDGLASRAAAIGETATPGTRLLSGRHMAPNGAPGDGFARRVWNAEKSPFRQKEDSKAIYKGVLLVDYDATDFETSNAGLTLHAALLAKSAGKTRFVFLPGVRRPNAVFVQFGAAGDPGFPDLGTLDVEATISELSARIPKPPPRS